MHLLVWLYYNDHISNKVAADYIYFNRAITSVYIAILYDKKTEQLVKQFRAMIMCINVSVCNSGLKDYHDFLLNLFIKPSFKVSSCTC